MSERPAGRKAWCPTCRIVDMVDADWRCCWCGELTLKRHGSDKRRPRESQCVRAGLLIEAHRAYAEGASVAEAAAVIQQRAGYADNRLLRGQLTDWWSGLGLPCRSHGDAQRLRYERGRWAFMYPEITVAVARNAVAKHGSHHAAAAALGVSRKTIGRRLKRGCPA